MFGFGYVMVEVYSGGHVVVGVWRVGLGLGYVMVEVYSGGYVVVGVWVCNGGGV